MEVQRAFQIATREWANIKLSLSVCEDKDEFTKTFGGGYSCVRTGWFYLNGDIEKHHIIKHLFFYKLFFPLGGDFTWDFNSPVVKSKLKVVFSKFAEWQEAPR